MLSNGQIIGMVFIIIMTCITFYNYMIKKKDKKAFRFWSILWGVSFLIILLFQEIGTFATNINIEPFDFLVLLAILFLIGITFINYTKIKDLRKSLKESIEEAALRDSKKIFKEEKTK